MALTRRNKSTSTGWPIQKKSSICRRVLPDAVIDNIGNERNVLGQTDRNDEKSYRQHKKVHRVWPSFTTSCAF
jgi:hypothetical protein